MAEWENSQGESDEWYTPPEIFEALGLTFCLDPCSPGKDHWVPAQKVYTEQDDGLTQQWDGIVFVNPPFGGRNGHVPWLQKFVEHGHGIILVRAYTSAKWFQDYAPLMGGTLFPRGKTKFVRADGSIGKSPGSGIVLWSLGFTSTEALKNSNLGLFYDNTGQKLK